MFVRQSVRLASLLSQRGASLSQTVRNGSSSPSFMAQRVHGFDGPSVWTEFSPLAAKHGAVQMGQGFPNWDPPAFVREELKTALDRGFNQYARSAGHLPLTTAIARRMAPLLQHEIHPEKEVFVGVGATEVMFAATQGILNPGDEVIVFEPSFDIYNAQAKMAGAKVVPVPLRVEGKLSGMKWDFSIDEFRSRLSPKTRMIIINTPHNPTGMVFGKEKLEQIAEIVKEFPNVIVLMDEVYEHLVYDGRKHFHFASLPGMWDRTLTISSAGKTFSCTGWKVGWAVGPSHLILPLAMTHQWVSFSVPTPTQEAIARSMEIANHPYEGFSNYYEWLLDMYTKKRRALVQSLKRGKIIPIVPEGGFFIVGDTRFVDVPESYLSVPNTTRDWALCRYLTIDVKVSPIPPSAFYCDENKHLAADLARFAFCKQDSDIFQCGSNLLNMRNKTPDDQHRRFFRSD